MLALLRLALGWHFLYEGVWKIRHPDQFVGEMEGFLSAARGPLAGYFYRMIPDIDGHQRLVDDLTPATAKEGQGKQLKLAQKWDDVRQRFVTFYRPKDDKEETKKLYEELTAEAKKVYDRHVRGLNQFASEKADEIKAHFESLKRYEDGLKTDPRSIFQTQRRWDEMQDLRKETKTWLADLDSRENALKAELKALLRKERKYELEAELAADKKAADDAAAKKTDSAKASATTVGDQKQKPKAENSKVTAAKTTAPEAADKPSEPPQNQSQKPAKTKDAKAKETDEPGNEESGEAVENKAAENATKAETATKADESAAKTAGSKADKKADSAAAKAPAEAKAKEAAGESVVVTDFSPLAKPDSDPFARSSNPFSHDWKRTEQMALLLTWTLAAIGLCLMLGLFTRLSALLGAGFLLFVILSQPAYPGVYPLDPPQMGHALFVNKDFVELTALLVIASTSVGRWTGLDCFIRHCCCCCKSSKTAQ
jgi:uncharacterized membrane protein YphA (DoxX/SURF4 family)